MPCIHPPSQRRRSRSLARTTALAAVLIGLVSFGLGLLNVPGVVVSMITGTMLIVVVALPLLLSRLRRPTR